MRPSLPFIPVLLLLALAACSKSEPEAAPAPKQEVKTASPRANGPAHAQAQARPITWNDPPEWKARSPRTNMRAAEYTIPVASGDPDDAECFVITFPGGGGGNVEQNISRWTRQFEDAKILEKSQKEVNGLHVNVLDVSGTYKPMAMPNEPVVPPKPRYRMLGAIVETDGGGSWFFKLTGPEATVDAAKSAFNAWIDSVKKS